jgi:DNA repair protein RadC
MMTHGETLSSITTSTKPATAGPRLRELTYRYQPKYAPDGQPITLGAVIHAPKASAAALTTLLRDEAVEVFGILCLTTTHRVICWHEVGRGSLDSVIVTPREVFKPAIMANAAAIIAGHCHPSGDTNPSPEDLRVTQCLVQAGVLLGIQLLDHIIIGDGSYVSFRETGRL